MRVYMLDDEEMRRDDITLHSTGILGAYEPVRRANRSFRVMVQRRYNYILSFYQT